MANVATALALLVAAGAFVWQIRAHLKEKAYTKSKFALESALGSYEQAIELLSDGNNNRITWITAARIVERANQLSANVTEQVHKYLLEVQLERYRRQMAEIFGLDDPAKGAWFFYGSRNPGADIDTAAKESTREIETDYGKRPQLNYLSESSLATLYKLAGYPPNYEDPLKKESLEGKTGIEMRASFPGLFHYLTHRTEHETINGVLVKRGPDNNA